MRYPLPKTPPVLSFDGAATFFIDSILIGESPVRLECQAAGRVLCWCMTPPLAIKFAMLAEEHIRCEGALRDGRPFACSCMRPASSPSEGVPDGAIALYASRLFIGSEELVREWTFALTNLLLQNFSTDCESANATLKDYDVRATLLPEADYPLRMSHLRAFKGIDVTATLRLSAATQEPDLILIAGDMCLILSVLTGHKVNWVARQADTALVFEERVTKPCSGWPVLGRLDQALGKDWTWQDLLNAASAALPAFEQRAAEYPLRCGLIDSWIDARIETDFLETRGLKTVAVLEVVKSAYRDQRNVQGTFLQLLTKVHNDLIVTIPAPTLARIVEIRNSLVHEGRFLPIATIPVLQQYELLSHHVDRLMLAIVGYQE